MDGVLSISELRDGRTRSEIGRRSAADDTDDVDPTCHEQIYELAMALPW